MQVYSLGYDQTSGTLYCIDASSSRFLSIDVDSGIAMSIGSTPVSTIGDLAVHPITGEVYGIDTTTGFLFKVNKSTGAATFTGISGLGCFSGLEFDSTGQWLYATDVCMGMMVRIDPVSWKLTRLGFMGSAAGIRALAMDGSSGRMYGLDPQSGLLVVANLTTGGVEPVGGIGFLSTIFALASTGDGQLYSVHNELNALLRIDAVSGAASTVRRLGGDSIKGVAFDTQTKMLYGADAGSNQLLRIDPCSGSTGVAGGLDDGTAVTGVAFHPSSHLLWGCDRMQKQLVQIDPATAKVTPIGSFGDAPIAAIAFDDVGILYGADDLGTGLYEIDQESGSARLVGSFSLAENGIVTSLSFNFNRKLLVGHDSTHARWLELDRLNGKATVIGPSGISQLHGLAWIGESSPPETHSDFRYTLLTRASPSTQDVGELPVSDAELSCSQPLYAELWVRDEGSLNTGVTCAYADIVYDTSMMTVAGVDHSALFGELPFASGTDNGTGRIDEFGGCYLPSVPGAAVGIEPQWACVGRVRFDPVPADCRRSCGTSTVALHLEPALNESSAFGRGIISVADILYDSAGPELHCACLYDLTGDCLVNSIDLGVLAPSWRKCAGNAGYDPRADFDCSGCVGGGDIGYLATAWLRSCGDPGVVFAACKGCGGVELMAADAEQLRQRPGVQFALRLADQPSSASQQSGGLPGSLQQVRAGQRLFAEFWMRDLDPASAGLVGGFADLHFSPGQFHVARLDADDAYSLMASGDSSPGSVRGWGGICVAASVGAPTWVRVGTAELEALVDSKSPRLWLEPGNPDPAARFGSGAVLPDQIEVLQAFPVLAAGDFDGDGDVDQIDFGILQRCLVRSEGLLRAECADADLNGDHLVNGRDMAAFQKCMSGPAVPADLICDP